MERATGAFGFGNQIETTPFDSCRLEAPIDSKWVNKWVNMGMF